MSRPEIPILPHERAEHRAIRLRAEVHLRRAGEDPAVAGDVAWIVATAAIVLARVGPGTGDARTAAEIAEACLAG